MVMTDTLEGLRAKINFAKEMITELARCKTRATWLLSDELKQSVYDYLDNAIRELQRAVVTMEREQRQSPAA